MMVVMACFGIGGVFPEDFVEDRRKTMVPPSMNLDAAAAVLPTKLLQIRANLDRLEALLRDGRSFLLGDDACLADVSAFHPVMMLGLHERTGALLGATARGTEWMERVRSIGHGTRRARDASDAIAIAHKASPAVFAGEPVLPDGMALSDSVIVLADEYGSGTVAGALAASDLHEIAVRRQTERAGEVVVHFPREDYAVIAAG